MEAERGKTCAWRESRWEIENLPTMTATRTVGCRSRNWEGPLTWLIDPRANERSGSASGIGYGSLLHAGLEELAKTVYP